MSYISCLRVPGIQECWAYQVVDLNESRVHITIAAAGGTPNAAVKHLLDLMALKKGTYTLTGPIVVHAPYKDRTTEGCHRSEAKNHTTEWCDAMSKHDRTKEN